MPPKAETMPGGAKLKKAPAKKRPCKYGARVNGLCPKKPKAPPKPKKPCKYGPRDADGYCPKKPREGAIEFDKETKTVTVVTKSSPKATPKKTPIQEAIRTNVERELAKEFKKSTTQIRVEIQKALKRPETKAAGLAFLKKLGKVAAPLAVVLGAIQVGKWGTEQTENKAVQEMRRDAETRLKRPFTAQEWKMLEPQYRSWIRRKVYESWRANPFTK